MALVENPARLAHGVIGSPEWRVVVVLVLPIATTVAGITIIINKQQGRASRVLLVVLPIINAVGWRAMTAAHTVAPVLSR